MSMPEGDEATVCTAPNCRKKIKQLEADKVELLNANKKLIDRVSVLAAEVDRLTNQTGGESSCKPGGAFLDIPDASSGSFPASPHSPSPISHQRKSAVALPTEDGGSPSAMLKKGSLKSFRMYQKKEQERNDAEAPDAKEETQGSNMAVPRKSLMRPGMSFRRKTHTAGDEDAGEASSPRARRGDGERTARLVVDDEPDQPSLSKGKSFRAFGSGVFGGKAKEQEKVSNAKLDELKAENDNLKAKLAVLSDNSVELRALQVNLRQQCDMNTSLQEENEQILAEMSVVRKANDIVQLENNKFQTSLDGLWKLIAANAEDEDMRTASSAALIASENARLNISLQQMSRELKELKDSTSSMRETNDRMKGQIDDLMSTGSDAASRAERAEASLAKQLNEVNSLKQINTRLTDAVRKAEEKGTTLDTLQSELRVKSAEVISLKKQLSSERQTKEDMQKELVRRQESVQSLQLELEITTQAVQSGGGKGALSDAKEQAKRLQNAIVDAQRLQAENKLLTEKSVSLEAQLKMIRRVGRASTDNVRVSFVSGLIKSFFYGSGLAMASTAASAHRQRSETLMTKLYNMSTECGRLQKRVAQFDETRMDLKVQHQIEVKRVTAKVRELENALDKNYRDLEKQREEYEGKLARRGTVRFNPLYNDPVSGAPSPAPDYDSERRASTESPVGTLLTAKSMANLAQFNTRAGSSRRDRRHSPIFAASKDVQPPPAEEMDSSAEVAETVGQSRGELGRSSFRTGISLGEMQTTMNLERSRSPESRPRRTNGPTVCITPPPEVESISDVDSVFEQKSHQREDHQPISSPADLAMTMKMPLEPPERERANSVDSNTSAALTLVETVQHESGEMLQRIAHLQQQLWDVEEKLKRVQEQNNKLMQDNDRKHEIILQYFDAQIAARIAKSGSPQRFFQKMLVGVGAGDPDEDTWKHHTLALLEDKVSENVRLKKMVETLGEQIAALSSH